MTKSDFFNSLKESLKPLSKGECNKFIIYYEEIIEDYKESGLTEEEAVDKLGYTHSISNVILSDQDNVDIKISPFNNYIINILLLVLGFPLWGSLLLAVALLILSANIIIWCIPFITGVSSTAFFIAALVSIIGAPFMVGDILSVGIMQLGVGIALIGISILLAFLTVFLSRKFIVITKKLSLMVCKRFNKKVVRL